MSNLVTKNKIRSVFIAEVLHDGVRLLYLNRKGESWQIQHQLTIDLTFSEEATAKEKEQNLESLQTLLRPLKLKPQYSILVLPKKLVTLKQAKLPSADEKELRSMVRFEAEKFILDNAERHMLSFHVEEHLGIEGSRVMIGAIDSVVVKPQLDLFNAVGIVFDEAIVSSQSLFNLHLAADDEKDTSSLIVHVGRHATDLVVVVNHQLRFSRSVNAGWESLIGKLQADGHDFNLTDLRKLDALDLPTFFNGSHVKEIVSEEEIQIEKPDSQIDGAETADRWLNRLSKEIQRTWDFATREGECPPLKKIITSGAASSWLNLDKYLNNSMGCEIHSLEHGWNDLEISSETKLEPATWNLSAGSLGQVMHEEPISINLLPEEYLKQQVSQEQLKVWLSIIFMFIIFAGLCTAAWFSLNHKVEIEYKWYKAENDKVEKLAKSLDANEKRLDILETSVFDERSALRILDTLNNFDSIPTTVTLKTFNFRRNKELTISGHTRTIPEVTAFRRELQDTELFYQVEVTKQQKTRLPRRPDSIYEFNLRCEFPPAESEGN